MHFFNPVPLMGLVEVIRGLETSDETADAIIGLARELDKTPAEVRDYPGFVANRILMPLLNEAAYALMEGVADAESIDTIAPPGPNHPPGPLALADLIGLDTCRGDHGVVVRRSSGTRRCTVSAPAPVRRRRPPGPQER